MGNFDWKALWIDVFIWIKGLIAAGIAGGANSIAVVIVDPINFNLQAGLNNLITVGIVSAIVGACLYLIKSPIFEYEPVRRKTSNTRTGSKNLKK